MEKYKVTVDDDGTIKWYNEEGDLHRLDGPAVESADGYKGWYQKGLCHRLDGPAIEHANGTNFWFQEGRLHREGGPATECINGNKSWLQEGLLHREDGPAAEYSNGDKEWHLDGVRLTEEEFNKKIKTYERKIVEISGEKYRLTSSKLIVDEIKGGRIVKKYIVVAHEQVVRWYNEEGIIHRDEGPALEWKNGHKYWYQKGLLHRDNGPAIEDTDGSKSWYQKGLLHREDGPAKIYADGSKLWYEKGRLHRLDGPAIIYTDNRNDYWYINGKLLTKKEFDKRVNGCTCEGKVVEIDGEKYTLEQV